VVVKKVFAGSAAEQAGLKPGQIVTQIDGISVAEPKTAVAVLSESAAGERISLTVIDSIGVGIRQSNVIATLAANPPGGFAAIMTAKPKLHHVPCHLHQDDRGTSPAPPRPGPLSSRHCP
jgi:predicted metalloprotease with PDZ domain